MQPNFCLGDINLQILGEFKEVHCLEVLLLSVQLKPDFLLVEKLWPIVRTSLTLNPKLLSLLSALQIRKFRENCGSWHKTETLLKLRKQLRTQSYCMHWLPVHSVEKDTNKSPAHIVNPLRGLTMLLIERVGGDLSHPWLLLQGRPGECLTGGDQLMPERVVFERGNWVDWRVTVVERLIQELICSLTDKKLVTFNSNCFRYIYILGLAILGLAMRISGICRI